MHKALLCNRNYSNSFLGTDRWLSELWPKSSSDENENSQNAWNFQNWFWTLQNAARIFFLGVVWLSRHMKVENLSFDGISMEFELNWSEISEIIKIVAKFQFQPVKIFKVHQKY